MKNLRMVRNNHMAVITLVLSVLLPAALGQGPMGGRGYPGQRGGGGMPMRGARPYNAGPGGMQRRPNMRAVPQAQRGYGMQGDPYGSMRGGRPGMGMRGGNIPNNAMVPTGHGLTSLSSIPNPALVDRFKMKMEQQQQQGMPAGGMSRPGGMQRPQMGGRGAAATNLGYDPYAQAPSAARGTRVNPAQRGAPQQRGGRPGGAPAQSARLVGSGYNQAADYGRSVGVVSNPAPTKGDVRSSVLKVGAQAAKAKQIGVYQHRSGLIVPIVRATVKKGRGV